MLLTPDTGQTHLRGIILPAVTRGEICDEAIFVTSKAKNVGMATTTVTQLGANNVRKKSPGVAEGSLSRTFR